MKNELVSSKMNHKQGGKGGGGGGEGNLTPWVIIQRLSFNTLVFFGFSTCEKKKRFFFAV